MPKNGDIFTTLFTPEQVNILKARAISPEVAANAGVRSVRTADDLPEGCPDYWTTEAGYLPGLLFRYQAPISGTVEYQLRPDVPVVKDDGTTAKYVFRKGAASVVHRALHWDQDQYAGPLLLTEGTCQTIAAAAAAMSLRGTDVYGIAGCQSWMKAGIPSADLAVVAGRDVLIALDADAATNRDVYDAGVRLREECLVQGAASVRFLRTTGGAKSGLDDVLSGQLEERRGEYLSGLIKLALERPKMDKPEAPARTMPAPRRASSDSSTAKARFFNDDGIMVETLADAVEDLTPVALSAERKIAVYVAGVYRIDPLAFSAAVGDLLGDLFRSAHRGNVEEFLAGRLSIQGRTLPDRPRRALMNVSNGMVDLKTLKLKDHDPKYLSSVQFPVAWDEAATAPVYERWIKAQAGDQVDALEETIAAVLDPTNTPQRAAFLFGKARSGKGTFLRLIEAVVGEHNRSSVDLARLATDPFAAANVYGKALNVSGDLPAMHVEDVSMFKKMTGQDTVGANRKHGNQFEFRNKALFVFAGNELPTVGESSRAYVERIRPFEFDATFAGKENPEIEKAMMAELPGILVRWVKAWQRRQERGEDLPIDPRVSQRFEVASDRVRQFLEAWCVVGEGFATTTDLYSAFKEWAKDQGGSVLGRTKFAARVLQTPGVNSATGPLKNRGWAVALKPANQRDQDAMYESTALDTEADAELQSRSYFPNLGKKTLLESEDISLPQISGNREDTATLHPVELHSLVHSPLDALFVERGDPATPQCWDCGTPQVLMDRTWWACPSCHPETVNRSASTDQGE